MSLRFHIVFPSPHIRLISFVIQCNQTIFISAGLAITNSTETSLSPALTTDRIPTTTYAPDYAKTSKTLPTPSDYAQTQTNDQTPTSKQAPSTSQTQSAEQTTANPQTLISVPTPSTSVGLQTYDSTNTQSTVLTLTSSETSSTEQTTSSPTQTTVQTPTTSQTPSTFDPQTFVQTLIDSSTQSSVGHLISTTAQVPTAVQTAPTDQTTFVSQTPTNSPSPNLETSTIAQISTSTKTQSVETPITLHTRMSSVNVPTLNTQAWPTTLRTFTKMNAQTQRTTNEETQRLATSETSTTQTPIKNLQTPTDTQTQTKTIAEARRFTSNTLQTSINAKPPPTTNGIGDTRQLKTLATFTTQRATQAQNTEQSRKAELPIAIQTTLQTSSDAQAHTLIREEALHLATMHEFITTQSPTSLPIHTTEIISPVAPICAVDPPAFDKGITMRRKISFHLCMVNT